MVLVKQPLFLPFASEKDIYLLLRIRCHLSVYLKTDTADTVKAFFLVVFLLLIYNGMLSWEAGNWSQYKSYVISVML